MLLLAAAGMTAQTAAAQSAAQTNDVRNQPDSYFLQDGQQPNLF